MFYAPMAVKSFGEVVTDNYKVDSSKLNLLFFGNVVENKRLDLLIDAIKGCLRRYKIEFILIFVAIVKMQNDLFGKLMDVPLFQLISSVLMIVRLRSYLQNMIF